VDDAEFSRGLTIGFLAFVPLFFLAFNRQMPPRLSAAISLVFFSVPLVLVLRFSPEGLRQNALGWYMLAGVALVAATMGIVFAEFAILRRPLPDKQTAPPVKKALSAIIIAAAVVFFSSMVWLHVRVLAPGVTQITPKQRVDRSQGPAAPASLLSSPSLRPGSIA